ncbi:serine/threonine protein kinase [Ktedonosporobacter rubrisoli]|uniref:non-specific serine/threonine protein kinase n=1 Tax=Ktedonosporobacter rubrisoli TaxID=2509675 RepID=A0A4P6K2E9_KTERU|nr:serine/threonine-protein kinase [Ktedonosporobacter rubrisoli]QBD81880.1 serine/threonine protein kinase [Ktedonosporobacter rubrisoli]
MITATDYIGKHLGNYCLTAKIAANPLSYTFLAEPTSLPTGQTVVIKYLHAIYIGAVQDQERFLAEAYLFKQLHPYILPILDAGFDKGVPYIVSKYMAAGNLHDRLLQQEHYPITLEQALTVISQIGQALHYIHQRNIIHGKLSPHNILFSDKGEALLADLPFTSLLPFLPTTSPVANEATSRTDQLQKISVPGKEEDQYALGSIAYELFTGRKPFTTPSLHNPGVCYKTKTLISPTRLNPALPLHIEYVTLKALAREPSQRYSSIQAFLAALNSSNSVREPARDDNANSNPCAIVPVQTQAITLLANAKNSHVSAPDAEAIVEPDGTASRAVIPITEQHLVLHEQKNVRKIGRHTAKRKPQGKRQELAFILIFSMLTVGSIVGIFLYALMPVYAPQSLAISIPPHIATYEQHSVQQNVIQPMRTAVIVPRAISPTPEPEILHLNPTQFSFDNCARYHNYYICQAHLSLSSDIHTNLDWTASSSGTKARFIPASGTLVPGQTTSISIIISTCTHNGSFIFAGGKNVLRANWSC